jgi:hypothetical protein
MVGDGQQLIQYQEEDGTLVDLELPIGVYKSWAQLKRAADYAWRRLGYELIIDKGNMKVAKKEE